MSRLTSKLTKLFSKSISAVNRKSLLDVIASAELVSEHDEALKKLVSR